MKRSKLSDQQIAFILRQAEQGTAVGEMAGRLASASGLLPVTGGLRDTGTTICGVTGKRRECRRLSKEDQVRSLYLGSCLCTWGGS